MEYKEKLSVVEGQYDELPEKVQSKYFNKYVETIVLVDSVKEIKTKKGDAMLFVKASDEEESLDFVLFPETYRKYGMIEKGSILKLGGKVEKRNGFQIIVSKVERF